MNPCINYPDSVTFVVTSLGDYGDDESVVSEHAVPSIVVQNTAYSHSNNQDAIGSDTVVYVDPENEFVQDNYFRLEELLLKINTFGGDESQNWFKVVSANISKDHLLCNNIDSVELILKKTASMADVS